MKRIRPYAWLILPGGLLAMGLLALLVSGPVAADFTPWQYHPPHEGRTKLLHMSFPTAGESAGHEEDWIALLPDVKKNIDGVIIVLMNYANEPLIDAQNDPSLYIHNPDYGDLGQLPGILDVCKEEDIPFYWGRKLWPWGSCDGTDPVTCPPSSPKYLPPATVLSYTYYEDFLNNLEDEKEYLETLVGVDAVGTYVYGEPHGGWVRELFSSTNRDPWSCAADCGESCITPSDAFYEDLDEAIYDAINVYGAPMADIGGGGTAFGACSYGWHVRALGGKYIHYKTMYADDIEDLKYSPTASTVCLRGEFRWDPPPCGIEACCGEEYDEVAIQLDWPLVELKPSNLIYNAKGMTVDEWASAQLADFYDDLEDAFTEFAEGGIIIHTTGGSEMSMGEGLTAVMQDLADYP